MSDSPPPKIGDRVGPFTLLEILGTGGLATVFRASREDGRVVALKVLHASKLHTEEVARFRREYEILRDIDHPGVVKALDSGRWEGYPWLALELVEGRDLGSIVESWKARPPLGRWKEIERIFRALCDALGYLHDLGVVHRDLKPGNILVGRDGVVRITDFGGVKGIEGHSTQLTAAGRLVGTIAFMAPEQITGDKADIRQDLYSLGAILYVMLTGRPPIESTTIAGYLSRHLTMTPPAPSSVDAAIPPALERVCMALLQKDPTCRPASARLALELLDARGLPARLPIHGREELLQSLLRRALVDGSAGLVVIVGGHGAGRSAVLGELGARLDGRGRPVLGDLDAIEAALASPRSEDADPHAHIVILDDADRLSDEPRLANLLASGWRNLLLFTTALPDELASPRFLGGQAEALYPESRVLEGLSKDSVVAMLKDRGLPTRIAEILGPRLQQEAWGLPGEILEQFQALLDAGWLLQASGGMLKAKATVEQFREGPLPLPERARLAEVARLQALPPNVRLFVEILSIIDDDTTPRLIERVTGLSLGDLRQAMEVLTGEGILKVREEGLDEVCSLVGGRVQQVAYALIAEETRAEWHRAVASALASLHRRRKAMAPVIASHLWKGGQPQEAWPLLLDAAWDAWNRKDETNARTLLLQARRCRADAEPLCDDLTRAHLLSRSLVLEGEMALIRQDLEAESFFMEAVRIARQGSDANVLGLALTGLGRSLVLRGDADGALEHLEEALTLASRASPRWALVGNALASVRLLLDDASGAHALWAEVADAAEKNADRSTLGQALTGQGLAEIAEGAERLANTSFERSEAALRPTRDRESLLALLIWQGNLSLLAGRYRETMDRMWEAEQLAKAAALQAELARVRGIRAEALLRIGQSEEAATLARQALDALDAALPIEIDAMDDDLTDAEARRRSRERLSCHHLARVLVELEASTRVLRAFPEPDGSEAPDFERTVLLSMAVRARALGPSDPAAAAGMARSVLAFSGSILPFLMARAEIDTALALRSIGQDEPSLQAASRAMARLQTGTWSGLKLEAAIARHRCGGGAGQRSRLLRIVDEVRQLLPLDDQVTFLQRPEIRELMG